MNLVVTLYQQIQNWLFPINCSSCGYEDTWLCAACIAALPPYPARVPFSTDICHTLVATSYNEPAVSYLIHALKYQGAASVARSLSQLLIHRIEQIDKNILASILTHYQPTIVVPVPLHRRRIAERGFNQSELLARNIAQHFRLAPPVDALRRTRHTSPQAALSRNERLTNIQSAFVANKNFSVRGKNVILIDDVATTGATLSECARALKKAGCQDIFAVVIARGTVLQR